MLHLCVASFETRPAGAPQDEAVFTMAPKTSLILRRLRSGRLGGCTASRQAPWLRLAGLMLLLILGALPVHAEDFSVVVAGLGGASFAEKEKAVVALGKSADPRAVPILQALGGDRLRKAPDGRVVIVDAVAAGAKLTDAATGQPLPDLASDSLDRVIVNNRLRGAIEAALGALTLFSPDRTARLAAALDALRHPSADTVALLEKALAAEQDSEIRTAMQRSLSASHLFAGSKGERLAAIRALAGATDPQVKNLLDEFRYSANIDPELYKAAGEALASIDSRLRWTAIAANLFQGISLGSVLLLAAIGLAITFGVMGVINMAHGEMIMLGAYVAFVVQQLFRAFLPWGWIDAYLVVAVPVAFLFAGLCGVVLERCLIRFLYGRPLETLLATWGVSLIMIQAARVYFGDLTSVVAPSWLSGGAQVMVGVYLPYNRLFIIALSTLCVVGIYLLLFRSGVGLRVRAVMQNRDMGACLGIPTRKVDAYTFAFGSGLAGLAGCALTLIGNVEPGLGQNYIVDSFMVVVTGGVGKLAGTIVASLGIGGLNKLLEPSFGAVYGKVLILVLVILFLQRRPSGLFTIKGRYVES